MANRYDPILCMMVDDSVKTEDRDPYAYEEIKKDIQIMKSGKASYITKNGIIGRISHSFNNRTITKEQKTELMNLVMSAQDAEKLHYYQHSYTKKWYVVSPDGKVFKEFNTEAEAKNYVNGKAQDVNTLYETFAHGNSKHAGVLEMNGKVKVVVWNEGDNPRTGKVTVIGEDTPANRSKAKSMLDSAKAKDSKAIDKAISACDVASWHIKE